MAEGAGFEPACLVKSSAFRERCNRPTMRSLRMKTNIYNFSSYSYYIFSKNPYDKNICIIPPIFYKKHTYSLFL